MNNTQLFTEHILIVHTYYYDQILLSILIFRGTQQKRRAAVNHHHGGDAPTISELRRVAQKATRCQHNPEIEVGPFGSDCIINIMITYPHPGYYQQRSSYQAECLWGADTATRHSSQHFRSGWEIQRAHVIKQFHQAFDVVLGIPAGVIGLRDKAVVRRSRRNWLE